VTVREVLVEVDVATLSFLVVEIVVTELLRERI
jgi:hypothetical protein